MNRPYYTLNSSSVARRRGVGDFIAPLLQGYLRQKRFCLGIPAPLARRKKKNRKNALSAHLRGLFAATQVSNDF